MLQLRSQTYQATNSMADHGAACKQVGSVHWDSWDKYCPMAYLAVLYMLQPKITNYETTCNKFCQMRCPYISFQIVPPKRDLEHCMHL